MGASRKGTGRGLGNIYRKLPMDVETIAAEVEKAKCAICDKGSKYACIYVEKNSDNETR